MSGPLEEQDGPLEEQDGHLHDQDGPLEEQDGPLDDQTGSFDEQRGPFDDQGGPFSTHDVSLHDHARFFVDERREVKRHEGSRGRTTTRAPSSAGEDGRPSLALVRRAVREERHAAAKDSRQGASGDGAVCFDV
jgi:hypothetical protein